MRWLSNAAWQFELSLFVLGHFSFLGVGLGLSVKWAGVAQFFDPTIAPQNPAVRLLGRRGGFDVIGPLSWLVKSCPSLALESFHLTKACSWRFDIWSAPSLNSGS